MTTHRKTGLGGGSDHGGAHDAVEARYRRLFATAHMLLVTVADDGRITGFDAVAEDITGFRASDVRGKEFAECFITPEDSVRFNVFLGSILAGREMRNQEFRIRIKGNFLRHMILNATPESVEGALRGGTITALDITPMRVAEQARVASERRLEDVLSQVPVVLFSYNSMGGLIHVTDNISQIFGISPRDFSYDPERLAKLMHPEDRAQSVAHWEYALRRALPFHDRFRIVDPRDKRIRWVERRIFVKHGVSGEPVSFEGMAIDITEQIEKEQERGKLLSELERGRRLRAIGQMAGGVAHDFNNLFEIIVSLIDQMVIEGDLTSRQLEILNKVATTTERAGSLTAKLLALARKRKAIAVPADLHSVIDDVIFIVRETFDRSITIEKVLCAESPSVLVDPGELEDAILNLAINARDALLPRGGVILFSTRVVSERSGVELPHGLSAGDYVELSIKDNGSGMPPEVKERLFEPFFTTKGPDAGTGLGLAGVFAFVKESGGGVAVDSEPGKGSAFKLYFPIRFGAPEESSTTVSAASLKPVPGRGVILLADDEQLVRESLASVLRKLGYDVVEAANGAEAIDAFKTRDGSFSLVVLDMLMPGVNGIAAFREIRTINSRAKVVILSGFAQAEQERQALDEGVAAFVMKPIRMAAFSKLIKGIIDGVADEGGK